MTDAQHATPQDEPQRIEGDQPRPQYGVGPFTLREVVLAGIWLVAFVVSFFPVTSFRFGDVDIPGAGVSVWTAGLDWILTIGVPTVAVFLLVLRRLSPSGIRRVGSLGVDQFASVAFSVSATVWLTTLWSGIATAISTGFWVHTWVVWVSFFLALAGVVLTVAAPFIPPFSEDFAGRPEQPAHRNARAVRPVAARPPRPRAEPAAPVDPYAPPAEAASGEPAAFAGADYGTSAYPAPGYGTAYGTGFEPAAYGTGYDGATYPAPASTEEDLAARASAEPSADPNPYAALGLTDPAGAEPAAAEPVSGADDAWAPQYSRGREGGYRRGSDPTTGDTAQVAEGADAGAFAPGSQTVDPQPAQPAHQAFWALAPVERDVYDELGNPVFRIGPTAWALVIEDRGTVFVIRHEDGRIGYLHDTSGVTRG